VVRHARGKHARHPASHDTSANGGDLIASLELELNVSSREETKRRFDQRATRGDIDHRRFVARANTCMKDPKVGNGVRAN